jgi:methyl-accepting chemotaxis protein
MIQGIAAAAEQQSCASKQVAENIESISVAARQTTQGATQSAVAATQLSNKAEILQRLVRQFKVSSSQKAVNQAASIEST